MPAGKQGRVSGKPLKVWWGLWNVLQLGRLYLHNFSLLIDFTLLLKNQCKECHEEFPRFKNLLKHVARGHEYQHGGIEMKHFPILKRSWQGHRTLRSSMLKEFLIRNSKSEVC